MDLCKLYFDISNDFKIDNPFETRKNNELFDKICDKHFGRSEEYNDDFEEAWEDLCALVSEERENAFIVGYKTALSLILAGTL
ncbi:MAG: hypothetical protein KH382_08110 [Clostridiales bacterium]|nr:hypothetical protein [Clostridiales bacterium]